MKSIQRINDMDDEKYKAMESSIKKQITILNNKFNDSKNIKVNPAMSKRSIVEIKDNTKSSNDKD